MTTSTEKMILEAFHKRAANTSEWEYVVPKAVRVHPGTLHQFFIESAREREERAKEFEPYFPDAAARERADAQAMVWAKVSHWIDPYNGQAVDVIYDDTVPVGDIQIDEADREG